MALGYALLHPGRVELALGAEPRQAVFDDLTDIVMSLVGGGNPGSAATELLDSVRARMGTVGQLLTGLAGANGPFGAIASFLSSPLSGMPDLAGWLDRIVSFLEALAPETLRQKVTGWLDALFRALPVLDSHQMFLTVRDLLSQALAAFEKPFLDGRRDVAAHRLVRAATVAHSYLDSMLENLEDALGGFSVRPMVTQLVDGVLGGLSFTGMDRVIQSARDVRDAVGPILTAMSNLSLSLTVSVNAGGPSPQPASDPTWRDDGVPTPHMPGHALWWMDLITNAVSFFNLLWEMIRTAHWHRPVEVILSVLEVAWQLVRTLVRAICPGDLNGWDSFPRWLFTDQAQFCLGMILRFFGSLHDAFAAPNYFLSAGLRLLRYYSYALSPRMFYLFARSWWYLQSWKGDPWLLDGSGNPTTTRAPISIVRYCFALWPVNWIVGAILGSVEPWADYNIAELQHFPLTIVMLLLSVFGGWGLSLLVALALGGSATDYPLQTDGTLLAVWAVATVWVMILAIAAMLGVNQLANKWWIPLVLGIALLVLIIVMAGIWAGQPATSTSAEAPGVMHVILHVTGWLVFGAFGFIAWWYYVNEGRDAEGYWDRLDATNSPYKLPYPTGRVYFCGQANHGVFSHYQSSAPNRYSFDFNDDENEPVWAARDGLVVDVREIRTNGSGDPNWIIIQHLAWDPNHDPGADDERVLTYATYFHLSQDRVWAREGQRVAQGQYIADLDDTGVSALHHLHFGVNSFQRMWFEPDANLDRGDEGNIPIVFRDPSVRGFRNYPLFFSWLPGGGHHDGKPIAMSFYESSNQSHEPLPHPMAVTTQDASATGVANHHHEIHLDPSLLPGQTLPDAGLWVRTTWREGHFHTIKLEKADLVRILQRRDLAGLTTREEAGHSHTLQNDAHGSSTYPDDSQRSHVEPRIAHPPPGQVQARRPGPYHLLGEELVLRVNDRATEYYLFGASRPTMTGNLTLDRAPAGDLRVNTGGVATALATPARALTVRQAARELDQAARAAARDEAFRAVPVLILETTRRGKTASLRVGASTIADALGLDDTATYKGSGDMDDFDAMSGATLGNLLRDRINGGWPADPLTVTATMTAGMLELRAGTDALEFSSTQPAHASSTPRIAAALQGLYRHAGTTPSAATPVVQATGALPLTTGRLVLRRGDVTWSIPVLGTPARVELDLAHPALSGAARAATPLRLRLRAGATEQKVWFRAGAGAGDSGDTPEDMARRISAQAEGVRARVNAAGKIAIETVAAGHEVDLHVDKDAPTGSAALSARDTGTSPAVAPAAGGPTVTMGDSTALAPDLLGTIIADARWRGAQGANPDAITASVVDDRIVLAHATKTVHLTHDGTGLGFAANGTALRSAPLTGARPRPGGWLDVHVDTGPVFRAVLDAEPARVDGKPLRRLPRNGETIQVAVNGADTTIVTFGAVRNVYDVAAAIATQVSGITVRVGYRLAMDTVLPSGPEPRVTMEPAAGAASAGFSHDLPRTAHGWGQVADPLAVQVSGQQLGRRAARHHGPLVPAFTASAHLDDKIKLTASSAQHVLVVRPLDTNPIHDPLQLTAAGHELVSRPIPADFDLGGHCVGYRICVDDAGPGGTSIAETIVQISAAPATVVTTLRPHPARIPNTAAGGLLIVHSSAIGGPDHECGVDLREVADLHEVAGRINAAVPLVAAWVDRVSGHDRLHIQTRGGGTSWRLRLENHAILAALGFDPATMIAVPAADASTPPTFAIEVSGRGNLSSNVGVSRTRLVEIFQEAARHITQLDDPSASVRRSFVVETGATANELMLHAAGGVVALESRPDHLIGRLGVGPGPGGTRIAPGSASVRLDSGVIRVRVDGRLVAAAELHGGPAVLRAPSALPTDPAVIQQQLAHLDALTAASAIQVSVGPGTAVPVSDFPPPPASIAAGATGFEAVVAHLAEKVPAVWFGIVEEGGAKYLAMHSRKRGRGAQIDLNLGAIPVFGLLGWSQGDGAVHSASGNGNVPDLDQVPLADLRLLLEQARERGAGPQSILEARVDGTTLRVETLSPGAVLNQTAPADTPGGVSMASTAGRVNALEIAYPSARSCNPGLATFEVSQGPGTRRGVRALIWGTPARLPEMSLVASGADLNGKSLRLRVLEIEHDVTFSNIPAGNLPVAQARVAAQIEAGCRWQVRAYWRDNKLQIETRVEGEPVAIALLPTANDARGSFSIAAGAPTPGGGSVPDLAAVTAAQYAQALDSDDSAFVSEDPVEDRARCTAVDIDLSSCRPRDVAVSGGLPSFVRIASERFGCMSSVIPLVSAPSLELDRTLERGPAVRASVQLDGFAGVKAVPAGELVIALGGIPTAPDYAPATTVSVRFDGTHLTAQEVAARIHQELFQRGVGMAACYPDGVVVVETLVNGIAGAIELPAAGTTPAVAAALCPGDPRRARGWPGAGTGRIPDSFRSEARAPAQGTRWKFRTDRDATPGTVAWEVDFTVPNGTIEDCARALHAELGRAQQTGTANRNRIGIAAVGPDGCLYIEAVNPHSLFLFKVNDRDHEASPPLRVQADRQQQPRPAAVGVAPTHVGRGFEPPDEPGLRLRRVNQLRTVRYVRDGIGAGAIGGMNDLGWVRAPSDSRSGEPTFFHYWPAGRYLLAVRSEAARSGSQDTGGMIISHGVDGADDSRGFVHRARYWVDLAGFREMFWGSGTNAPDHWDAYNPHTGYRPTLGSAPLGLRRIDGALVVEMMVWWTI
jgi:murein DD-endopeptidase MepM/ murein hydrolase activator NlpD